MKESTWDECLEKCSAIEVTPFPPKVKSLIETAKSRMKFLKKTQIDEANCNFILEGYYASALGIFSEMQ